MSINKQEEIDQLGKWWVPGRDQLHHPGVLRFNKDKGPTLQLLDMLSFLTKPMTGIYTDRSFYERFPLVCGITERGPATLINFQFDNAKFLILGGLFKTEEEALFSRIQLQIQHFPEWLGQIIVQREITFWNDEKGASIGNEASYRTPFPTTASDAVRY